MFQFVWGNIPRVNIYGMFYYMLCDRSPGIFSGVHGCPDLHVVCIILSDDVEFRCSTWWVNGAERSVLDSSGSEFGTSQLCDFR